MKADEIQSCALCRKGVMADGLPLFWRVTCQRMGVDQRAVQQVTGLEMLIGNVALARVMGPNPDIANPLGDERTVIICERCAGLPTTLYQIGLPS